jgi:hypothetical protein
MISHHIYLCVALAHKESQMEAARQAHQAQLLRRLARTSPPRRSFLSRITGRLGALNYAGGHGMGIADTSGTPTTRKPPKLPAAAPAPWSTRSRWRPEISTTVRTDPEQPQHPGQPLAETS